MPVFSPRNSRAGRRGTGRRRPERRPRATAAPRCAASSDSCGDALRVAVGVVEDHEPGHRRAGDQQLHVVGRAARGLGGVVLRDRAAEHDARAARESREHGVEDLAADVVEEDVDAVRARARAAPCRRPRPCSRSPRRSPSSSTSHAHFSGAARDADHAAALDLARSARRCCRPRRRRPRRRPSRRARACRRRAARSRRSCR